ncbi:MAG TPA: hypothetical protein VNO21_24320 [Polyangiaceae bacterium]|nr:hypothetical protein [Polyangiaceae bacterium]
MNQTLTVSLAARAALGMRNPATPKNAANAGTAERFALDPIQVEGTLVFFMTGLACTMRADNEDGDHRYF